MAFGAHVERDARHGEALTRGSGIPGRRVQDNGLGRCPKVVGPVPERPPASVLVTQRSSQLFRPLWRNFDSGAPFALTILKVGCDE